MRLPPLTITSQLTWYEMASGRRSSGMRHGRGHFVPTVSGRGRSALSMRDRFVPASVVRNGHRRKEAGELQLFGV